MVLMLAVTLLTGCAPGRDDTSAATQRTARDVVRAVPVASPAPSPSPSSAPPDDVIDIGYLPDNESVAISTLWAELLGARDHTVHLKEVDPQAAYAGVADGSLDLFLSARMPAADAEHWETYGDRIEDLGPWYDAARLTWAVPDYVAVDSIAELRGLGDQFSHRVIGVESDARVMQVSKDEVLAAYELQDEYDVLVGSTTDMLAELVAAIDEREPIVVTLWEPHWAYAELPIKTLDDPEGAFGKPDAIHALASRGFGTMFPQVRDVVDHAAMDTEKMAELEIDVLNAGQGQESEGVADWLTYPDCKAMTDQWFAG